MANRAALRNLRKRRNKTSPVTERRLSHQTLERRELLAGDLGPQLISVAANSGENFQLHQQNILRESPTQLTFRFDGSQQIDPATLDAITIERAGGDGSFDEGNEIRITPGFLGFGDSQRIVIARFAETLPDDTYRISIAGFDDTNAGIVGLRNTDGELFRPLEVSDPSTPEQQIRFRIELGPQVAAVVPQPITGSGSTRIQQRDQIYVYFNEDPLSNPAAGVITTDTSIASVVQPRYYNLFLTGDTVENTDDGPAIRPIGVRYDPALNRAELTFASDLADLAPNGEGTFRLRVGSSQALPGPPRVVDVDLTDNVGDTFQSAHDLAVNFNANPESILISGEIEPTTDYPVQWPGIDAPGTRDNRRDPQVTGQPDSTPGINQYYYNFAQVYGTDPFNNVLDNAITDAQKQRTREILALYSQHLGVQFIETESRGLQIVTGDLRALVRPASTGPGEPFHDFRLNDSDPTQGVLILDAGEDWFDGYGLSPDERPSWFVEALRGIGSLLGIGHTFDQVPGVASGSNPDLYNAGMFPLPGGGVPSDFSIEPDFLSTSDIIPGQALHRPETRDVDLYRFNVAADGRIAIETFAQRLDETSQLDTDIKLWKLNVETGRYDLVARNDDYYSNDSFIGVNVSPNADGTAAQYIVGITASGNEDYNPAIEDSGMGGRSQGRYEMRLTFQNTNVDTIKDTNGTPLDGNGNGTPGGDFNFWFRTAKPKNLAAAGESRTLFVDKAGVNAPASGDLNAPYRTISYAFAQARPGDIVRILPSAGADGLIGTTGDNLAYEIGRGGPTNAVLSDGETFNVPRGVTVMIDAGTILKLRGAKISVGSERIDEDRSLAALQVLGVPILVDASGNATSGDVIFTSYQDESLGVDTNPLPTTPGPGQWAGIEFRNDFDYSEGRPVWETEGIFIDYVSHADIRYGGGSTAPTQPIVTPLQMLEARPTIINNTIRFSSDAAISADPNSFAETNFHAPVYQRVESFTSDYDRVGPDIRGNTLVDNSINGLFVRVRTPAAGQREPMTVSGRFDDADITHVISEVLVLQGQPGGPLMLEQRPDVLSVTVNAPTAPLPPTGTLSEGQTVDYRVTFVTVQGSESLASSPTLSATVGANRNLRLTNLPQAPAEFAGRRLYRFDAATGDYVFVTQLDRNTTSYLDTGQTRGGTLSDAALAQTSGERLLPRFDARLSIDPGLVIKLDSARIETGIGADFYAEGTDGKPIVFTSRLDDEYGAGGTFDTNNDGSVGTPAPGAWSGLVFRQGSTASLDHTIIRYAGGSSAIEGGFANFNPVEILQADVRIANSVLADNAAGSAADLDIRDGIGFNGEATIFVRGAQPVIVDNIIRDNLGAAISVNPDALNYLEVQDRGRSTGAIDRFDGGKDNQGPLVAGNRLADNGINGMLIRNEALTTESVWDDTDIVHVVERFVYAWNHHHRSGLRLKSHADQSLVVKLQDGGALIADRYLNDVEDSIGGTIQVIGQPGFPVVLTSLHDDTVGAGFTPSGLPQNNTDNATVSPNPGDWYGIVLRAGANDRNVAFVLESEPAIATAAAMNAIPANAQIIGSLATSEQSTDENRRLGFNIRGALSQNSDLDVYSFSANGQTEVFIDIDDTSFGLDTVVELIDINGNILALSQSSHAESTDPGLLVNNLGPGQVLPLLKTGQRVVEGPNTLDAGMRVILPGNSSTVNQYYVRVRSSNLAPGDSPSKLLDSGEIGRGLSSGQYQLSIRLGETDEIAGSTVRLADIRYATHAIDVPASPFDSPLAAEHAERLQINGLDVDGAGNFTNAGAQPLGALNESHRRVLRVSGFLGNNVANSSSVAAGQDIDVYRVDLFDDSQEPNIINENRFVSAIFDIDFADQLGRANTRLSIFDSAGRLILHGLDSNVADDQGRPRFGLDMENLGGGSAGTLDSYVGPVELQVGSYYVVVSSAQMTPEVLNQYFNSNAADTNIRMLPVDSVRRIAEEGFSDAIIGVNSMTPLSANQQLNTTAEQPNVVPLFNETSIVPYSLEDVRMFVTLQGGLSGSNQSTVITVDPFTGQLERTIGQFGQPVGDVAMRRDGELFAYSLGPQTGARSAANTGNYLNISPVDAATTNVGDDGLTFQRNNEAGTNTENDPNAFFLVNAMAFTPQGATAGASVGNVPAIPDGERVFVVGDRLSGGRGGEVPLAFRENVVYSMVANSGAATNQGSTNTNADRNFGAATTPYNEPYGPASNKQEYGVIDVGQFIDSDPEKTGGSITGIALNQNVPGFGGGIIFGVTDEGGLYSFNPSSSRTIDLSPTIAGSYGRVINTDFHGTVQRHDEHFGFGAPQFSSVTLGPRATEGGRYNSVFFATTTDGWLYTFHVGATGVVEPAPVLVNGRSAVPIITAFGGNATGGFQVTGVAFSTLEQNPWHQTGDRNTPFAVTGPNATTNLHGVFQPHNDSRIRTSGGSSLYFGFEPTANAAENTLDRAGTGNLAPGGVHGSTVSAPFSLEGYNSADKPTLYFNYFLETEANNDFTPGGTNQISNQQVDSFRVFAAGDDGQWRLVGTNNSWRSFSNQLAGDEYDYFATNGGIPVQELHDNTNAWRQARVDLSPLAGNKNVQLRFDFSTAGGMQSQFRVEGYQTEIQAVPGTELVNGSTFSLLEQMVSSNQFFSTFEFVRGAAINLPAGNSLLNGQQISIGGAGGTVNLTLTTDPPSGPNQVGFARGDSAAEIAAAVAAALDNLAPDLHAVSVGGQLLVPEANSFNLTPQRFGHAAIALPADVSTLEGQSLVLTNSGGGATSLTLRTSQQVEFSRGGQTVRVTANVAGAADGVAIRFVDNPALGDATAQATYNAGQRVITVTYNSQAATDTNKDFAAVVSAINGLAAFSAVLTAGSATAAFAPPLSPTAFPSDEVFFNAGTDTAASIATRLANRFNAADPRLIASAAGGQLTARGASAANLGPAFTLTSFNPGTTDSQLLPSGNTPIFYNRSMTDVQVRDAIRQSLAVGLGVRDAGGVTQATTAHYPGYGTNRVRVFEQALLNNNSAVGFSTFLPGDEFGAFGSQFVGNTQINTRPGANNNVEGVYIDDIVIGFASRGETVYNAPVNRNFVIDPTYRAVLTSDAHQPEFPDEILVGGYTLEVRGGPTYGVPHDYDPIRLGLNEQFSWGRSFDINDRFNPGAVTLNAPAGRELSDGQTFVISNGTRSVTFEFASAGFVTQPGNVRVPFVPVMTGTAFNHLTDSPAEVARAIRDAINSPQARNVLGITAAGGDSRETGAMTGNRVELFGDVIQINPSEGRFLLVDMVAESTPYGRESYRSMPQVDHENETVQSVFMLDSFTRATVTQFVNNSTQFVVSDSSSKPNLARATVTQYTNGQKDTLVAKGKIGDTVVTGIGNERIASDPLRDVDVVKIFLNAGDTIDALVETNRFNRGAPFRTPRVQIFADDADQTELADSLNFNPLNFADPGNPFGFINPVPFDQLAIEATIDGFVAPSSGYYFVAVSSIARLFGFVDPSELIGQYQLTVRPSGTVASDPLGVEYHLEGGDTNVSRGQGQLVIESNFISDFSGTGVRATYSGDQIPGRQVDSPLQLQPGGTALLRNQNTQRLLPGTVISNNVITATAGTGILYSGITHVGGAAPAPVPFGRIVNNTVVGPGSGTGINVTASTSPTVLNNVISGFNVGLNIAANSSSTVENANAFHGNTTASSRPLAAQSFIVPAGVELFEDASRRVYIPAAGSQIIDSSFASLNDRSTFFNTVKQPMGISASPIIAPIYDAYGSPRVDDPTVTTPGGVGSNVFIDRGGIDRADFVQPTAVLVSPTDFIAGQGTQVPGGDIDPDASFVQLPSGSPAVSFFEIQLLDPAGTGPDVATITGETVILTENGVTLTAGVDYTFGYSDNSRVIRLTPLAGLWRPDAVYEITLNNKDRVSLTLPSGSEIADGDQYIITDMQNRQSVFEFDSGYVLQVPQTLGLEVLGPNTFFRDGDVFSITAPDGTFRNFEINLSGAVASGNIALNIASAGTIEQIRDVILTAISASGVADPLDLAPRALGSNSLQIGSLAGHVISGNVEGLQFFGTAAGVTTGDQFRYQVGPDDILFEFTDGEPQDPEAVAIPFSRTDTIDEIAEAVAATVLTQPLGLASARSIGEGRLLLGGTPADVLTVEDTALVQIGAAGVTGALRLSVPENATAASLEGQTFTVQNGNVTVNFILTTNAALVTPNRRIVLTPDATADQIAAAIAAEIDAGFVGALSPSADGRVVTLGEQPASLPNGTTQVRATINTGTSSLVADGVSGGAIAVPFIPTGLFTPSAAAATLSTAIGHSPLVIDLFTPGGGTLLMGNTSSIGFRRPGGSITPAGQALPAVTDLAGNTIESNRDNDETRFTIIMPDVRFDFGDAPDSYGTTLDNNGARHSVGSSALPRLGRVIDTEPDGQPYPDSDDAVTPVTATSPNGSSLFSFTTLPSLGVQITIADSVVPSSGDRVRIVIGEDIATFELVSPGVASLTGNIAVPLLATDTPEIIAARLADAIRSELAPTGRAVVVAIDADQPAAIRVETLDDEDGVAIGMFDAGMGSPYTVFLRPNAPNFTSDPNDVLGFLNPLDPAGANIAVTVTGAGLLDAWIDFDGDGVFDPTREQVLTNVPVVDGVNILNIITPAGTADGTTWARFRLSTGGNLRPTGVAVGGEVEDYQVQIIGIPLPTPLDDVFTINEDTILDTTTDLSLPSLIDNDIIPPETFVPVQFFVGEQPEHGTLTIQDPTSGRFIYEPHADFSGVDTFTYRLSTQANAGATDPAGVTFATVTINVRPVNDPPLAVGQDFLTLENTPVTITAEQLLADAVAHANPQFPVGAPAAPWDESNQSLRVVSVQAGGIDIDASNATGSGGTPLPFETERGSIEVFFAADGSLIELIYTPGQDLNRDNVEPIGSGPVLDTFLFTIEDDGLLIDPETGDVIQGTPLTATATASIDVAPRNSAPTLLDDLVSVGIVGVHDPNTAWSQYFIALGLEPEEVPVPTEDQPLVIPAGFLLQNDLAGSPLALDENNFVAGNDGPLSIIAVSINYGDATVELDADGNILFTPPSDIYGDVIFTYEAIDQGIDEELDGTRTINPLTSIGTVTVTLQPVNDAPVAYDRALTFSESPNPGSGPAFTFTRQALITGSAGETPAVPGDFAPDLGAPFDEREQFLNVVQFTVQLEDGPETVDVTELTGVGSETLTLPSQAGGFYEFDFVDGIFTVGRFTSAADYNQRSPFAPLEQFTYRIEDDGRTTRPQGGGVVMLAPERSVEEATVSITVLPSNDAPQFDFLGTVDVLERDDQQGTQVSGFATNILPGPATALDELERQSVSFTILGNLSTVPAGLMTQLPEVTDEGTLIVYPAPDAVGTAVYVVEAIDAEPGNDDFVPRTTRATFTVNVRPVNDPPRINTAVAGTGQILSADDQWRVSSEGVITYTLKEDNTQSLGVTEPYIIEMRRTLPLPNYARIGLLDVFTVGPTNEADSTLGGSQILRLLNFDATTALGGSIEAIGFDDAGNITQLQYIPPTDYNTNLGGVDSFSYVVQDNNPDGGETWDLDSGSLIEDRRTATGRVEFVLRPVNDPPQFQLAVSEVSVLEDSGTVAFEDFAIDIFAGPPETAFDEIDPVSGQNVTFSVAAVSSGAGQLFAAAPSVSPSGTLSFRPAPNAYGTAVFELRATDDGADNAVRGDIVSSASQTFTINIRPVNDRPVLNTTTPISYTLNEDAAVLQPDGTVAFQGTFIPLRGNGDLVGLLDVFDVGPPNEAADITPGGNQTLRITTPIPASTTQGGTLTRVFDPLDSSVLIGLRYTPRANFNGPDTFIYGVIDDGVSVDLEGNVYSDPREAFNTVTLNVLPLNDPPQFSGPLSVTVDEDAETTSTIGLSIIENFVTDIAPGPPGAIDELQNQTVSFVVTPVSGNPQNLFASAPEVSSDGTLTFQTVQDANGVAVFTIHAVDSGPHNPPLEFNTSSPPRTFTITVNPVNDPPTFVPVLSEITVPEDSGPFTTTEPYATEISPGPPDEVAAGQTVRFEVTTAPADQALFQTLPNVTDNGFFRFTPAENAVGTAIVSVVAIDSEGAASEPVFVTITITEVNDAPVAGDITFDGDENTVLPVPKQSLLDVAFDPDLVTNPDEFLRLTEVATTSQAGATIRVLPSGDLEYDPREAMTLQALRPGQSLADTFTYRVIDAAGAVSNIATVTIHVAGINDPPTVNDDFATLNPDGPTIIHPLDNDFDIDGTIDPLTLQITLLPAFGSVEVQNDGTLIYTPFPGFRGTDTIRYTVADELGARSEQATITIDMNQAPVAVDDIAGTFRGREFDIDVAANDFDPDGSLDLDSIQIVTPPTRGTVIVLGGGIVRYVPGSDFVGVDTFEYTIRDDRGRPSNVGQVRVQVVSSELQNPNIFTDVNASGETTPLDALLILNRLARAARDGDTGQALFDKILTETPRLYYDVTGNRRVEPLDALAVINEIARQNRQQFSGQGELIAAAPPVEGPPQNAMMSEVQTQRDEWSAGAETSALTADFSLPADDIIAALAIDMDEQETEKRREQHLQAIDAAWSDLSDQ